MGVTKDTAARAAAALIDAGLLVRERVTTRGSSRAGYRLRLPVGVEICPTDPDTGKCTYDQDAALRPEDQDSGVCLTNSDSRRRPNTSDMEGRLDKQDRNAPSRTGLADRPTSGGYLGPCGGDAVAAPAHVDAVAVTTDQRELDANDRHMVVEPSAQDGALNRGVCLDVNVPLRRRRRGRAPAQNEAQGQLFGVAVTAESQDAAR